MDKIKGFILEWDFFAHGNLQRYKEEESYRTLLGGCVSIILVILFFIIFFNMTLNTFKKELINSDSSITYDEDPSPLIIKADPNRSFMFAIGVSGINLNAPQRYFDIVMKNRINLKNGSSTTKQQATVPLQQCTQSQWQGMGSAIANSYNKLGFDQWLCPVSGQEIPLQGKFTSQKFQFSEISISQCTSSNPLFPNTTCLNAANLTSYLTANGEFTINFYFVNPVLNPSEKQFVGYYLQDRNYFSFNTQIGVQSDLYFSDYSIDTDNSFFPWIESDVTQGFRAESGTSWRNFQIGGSNNEYFKIFLRKSAAKSNITRGFQKIDQTFSYIGGLFGTIILLLMFLNLYSKYSYELQFGDEIFKETNHGTFGSNKFNFIVFLGYCIYATFALFGISLKWKRMKRFHKCRHEVEKQLNIDLLYKKIAYFEEALSLVLKQHQLKMLLMTPKPTIAQTRKNRQRFLIRKQIYHNLERQGNEVYVSPQIFMDRLQQYLKQHEDQNDEPVFTEGQLEEIRQKYYRNSTEIYQNRVQIKDSGLFLAQKIASGKQLNRIAETVLNYTDKKSKGSLSSSPLRKKKGGTELPMKAINGFSRDEPLSSLNPVSQHQLTSGKKIKIYNDLMEALQLD